MTSVPCRSLITKRILCTAWPFEVFPYDLVSSWAGGHLDRLFSFLAGDRHTLSSILGQLICSRAGSAVLAENIADAGSYLYLAALGFIVLLICSRAGSDAVVVGDP